MTAFLTVNLFSYHPAKETACWHWEYAKEGRQMRGAGCLRVVGLSSVEAHGLAHHRRGLIDVTYGRP